MVNSMDAQGWDLGSATGQLLNLESRWGSKYFHFITCSGGDDNSTCYKKTAIQLFDSIICVYIQFRPTWIPILFRPLSSYIIMCFGTIYLTSLRPPGCPRPISQWFLGNELSTAGEITIYRLEPYNLTTSIPWVAPSLPVNDNFKLSPVSSNL